MFENQVKEEILLRMLAESRPDIDKRPGSVTQDMLSLTSPEFENAYISLSNVLTFGYAGPEQPREYLEKRAAEYGVYPKEAVQATGEVTFTGTEGTVIPIGTEVSTEGDAPVVFETTEAATITGGTAKVMVLAIDGGASGNVAAGAITIVGGNVSGITSVTNELPFDGGADIESDEAFLSRYLDRMRRPGTSGNANHYVQWAKEVPGVFDAKCYPVWNGNNTVKVVLIDDEGTAPAQSVVDAVIAYINDGRIPIGPVLTVVGATEVQINVTATLTLAAGATLSSVTTQFREALKPYLKFLAFVDPLVRYTRIANLLLDVPDIVDYTNLTVNGGTSNIDIPDGSVAVVGTVTFS